MALPTEAEMVAALRAHVDAGAADIPDLTECVREAMAFIEKRAPATSTTVDEVTTVESPLGDVLYRREVKELGSELYYRKQARNGVVALNTMDGTPIRVSADPFRASSERIARHRPWGFS